MFQKCHSYVLTGSVMHTSCRNEKATRCHKSNTFQSDCELKGSGIHKHPEHKESYFLYCAEDVPCICPCRKQHRMDSLELNSVCENHNATNKQASGKHNIRHAHHHPEIVNQITNNNILMYNDNDSEKETDYNKLEKTNNNIENNENYQLRGSDESNNFNEHTSTPSDCNTKGILSAINPSCKTHHHVNGKTNKSPSAKRAIAENIESVAAQMNDLAAPARTKSIINDPIPVIGWVIGVVVVALVMLTLVLVITLY